jgi:hypothetical protein
VDVRLHGHLLHLPSTRSSFDVLSSTRESVNSSTANTDEIKRSGSFSREALRKMVPHESPIIEENESDYSGGNRSSVEPTPIPSTVGTPTPVSDSPYVAKKEVMGENSSKNSTVITHVKHNTHQHKKYAHHHNVLVNIHSIVEYFAHGPHQIRHVKALHLLGVGSNVETFFLYLVTLFGVAVLIFTTVSSIMSIVNG